MVGKALQQTKQAKLSLNNKSYSPIPTFLISYCHLWTDPNHGTHHKWWCTLVYSKKIQTGWWGTEDILFWKPPLEFFIFYFTHGNSRQNKAQPLDIPPNCVKIPWKFQGQKQRPLAIPHYFFLVTLGYYTLFLINPWKFHNYFFDTPGNSISSIPPA